MNGIKFLNEKKWIMAYFFKRQKHFGKDAVFRKWIEWWEDDFKDENDQLLHMHDHKICYPYNSKERKDKLILVHEEMDQFFHKIYDWISSTISSMSLEDIRAERYKSGDTRSAPAPVQILAKELGYFVRKSGIKNHPLTVSGYRIVKANSPRNVICGDNFNMTLNEVRKFLESKQGEK